MNINHPLTKKDKLAHIFHDQAQEKSVHIVFRGMTKVFIFYCNGGDKN